MAYLNLSKSQSMTKIRDTRSAGRPIAVMTIKSVTSPASGIPAAPTLATVDVILRNKFYQKYPKRVHGKDPALNPAANPFEST